MTTKRITVLIDQPPRERMGVKEQVDLVLAALALEQEVTVVFVGNGVYHCCQPDPRPDQDPSAVYGSLALYDVDRLLVEAESLEVRGLLDADLRFGVERISRPELGDLLRAGDHVL